MDLFDYVSGEHVKRTLVIGDTHGHYDRLEALLVQEGILKPCFRCKGMGQIEMPDPGKVSYRDDEWDRWEECPTCFGDGLARVDFDTEIVQLGDIGHWGADGSPTGDIITLRAAINWVDVILWGNHDRACVDSTHEFRGYMKPGPEAQHLFSLARHEGKLKLAHEAYGYLLTHAGLHLAFRDQELPSEYKQDPAALAQWLNEQDKLWLEGHHEACNNQFVGIRDAIGGHRGGGSGAGGIIWRDINEKLYMGFPQVFGHSADPQHMVRVCAQKGFFRTHAKDYEFLPPGNFSYCVDVGGKGDKPGDNCLAGVYLPEERIVRVDL